MRSFRSLPIHESKVFGRAEFDALMASAPGKRTVGWEVRIDASTSVMMQKQSQWAPPNVLFVRRLKPFPQADVQKDYVRVYVYDVEGKLRTTAKTPKLRAFADELGRLVAPRLKKALRAREKEIEKAIASSPKIDRDALTDAVRAMTHGRARAEPIVDAVMLAASDPREYVRRNEERCADFGISAPVVGLHVIALIQRLPKDLLLYFDWKEDMQDVLPMLARLLRSGPRVDFRPKTVKSLKELAPALAKKGLALVEIDTKSDAHSIVCVKREDAKRIAMWRRRAHLPMKLT